MRHHFIVFVASLMFGGSAYAMPSENSNHHVPSYTYYGPKPVAVKVVPHNQNIPAPSHWVPPERIPVLRVVTVTRQQPPRVGSANSFSNPTFNSPTSSSPNFSNPSYSNPTASSPSYSNPYYSNPTSTLPSYSNPTTTSPSFNLPSYSNPSSDL